MIKLINFALFQAIWFGAIYLPLSYFYPLAVSVLLLHFFFIERKLAEVIFVIVFGLIGTLIDSLLLEAQVFSFPNHDAWLIPGWLIFVWFGFLTTLSKSLSYLQGQKILSALLGGLGAPLSYYAGAKLGALQINTFGAYLHGEYVLGVVWFFLTPILFEAKNVVNSMVSRQPE